MVELALVAGVVGELVLRAWGTGKRALLLDCQSMAWVCERDHSPTLPALNTYDMQESWPQDYEGWRDVYSRSTQ